MDIEKISATIKDIFHQGYTTNTSLSFEEINDCFKQINSIHSIVFFEGLSVKFALISFEKTNSLTLWNEYNRYFNLNFAKQNYIGLGWAMGELGINPNDYMHEIAHEWKSKVWNGNGYFTGTIKRRKILRTISFPKNIPLESLPDFIQGFGRSLWYNYKGNLAKITVLINAFKKEEQIHLWRGVGVAIAFVDGLSKEDWLEIRENPYIEQLKNGFLLAYPSLKNETTIQTLKELFKL